MYVHKYSVQCGVCPTLVSLCLHPWVAHPPTRVSRNFLEESDSSSMLYYNDSFYNDSGEVLFKGVIPNPKTPSVFKLKAYLGHY